VAMGRPGVAVDAAVLAAAVGIDRAVEADVGTVVSCDDAARGLDAHLGLEGVQRGEALPAVVELLPDLRLVAPDPVGACTAATAPLVGNERAGREMAAVAGCVRHQGHSLCPVETFSPTSEQIKNMNRDLLTCRASLYRVGA